MLDAAALDFVNHPRAIYQDSDGLLLSGLYSRYSKDFGGNYPGLLSHIKSFLAPGTHLDIKSGNTVKFRFDWSLNDGTGLRP